MPPNSTDAVGAAILGLPAADSAAVPREHTPDSWRVLLASHPDAAKVIMQSCTVGRDWVLSTAPKATLQLNCAAQASPWLWHRRVAAVADALHTRGTLPTTVKLKCDESGSCATQASVLFTGLRGASRGVQALQVHFDYTQLAPDNQPLTGLLQCAAQTFSGLRSLTVNTWKRCVLPAPALLPQLQHLSIDATDIDAVVRGSLTRSIAAFVPQLSSLEYQGADTAQLFQSLTHTLTHLTLGQALTDDSLQALVTHAPALQSLTVQSLSIGSDACQQEWRVTELKTSHRGWRERADPQVLARLPGLAGPGVTRFELSDMPVRFKAVDARVRACTHRHTHTKRHTDSMKNKILDRHECLGFAQTCGDVCSSCAQGLHQDVVSRLPQWRFTAHKYNIAGCWSKQPAEQVAALQAVLQQLGPVLRAPHTTDVCWADGWQWDMAMADALVSAKACLPHVTFTVDVYTLSDTQIGPVIRMWPAIASVSASSIELQQQHDGLVWPWEELSLGGFDVTDLVNFPRPAPGKTVTLKVVENVEITDAVTQVRKHLANSFMHAAKARLCGADAAYQRLLCEVHSAASQDITEQNSDRQLMASAMAQSCVCVCVCR